MKIEAHRKILKVAIITLLLISLPENFVSGDDSISAFKLTAGLDAGPYDKFGHSVAVSGSTMVVGALEENAAYVFEYDGGAWNRVARLTLKDKTSFT